MISTPSSDATLYTQQKEENEKQHCNLAIRKITVATIVGEGSDAMLTIQHHQLGRVFVHVFMHDVYVCVNICIYCKTVDKVPFRSFPSNLENLVQI